MALTHEEEEQLRELISRAHQADHAAQEAAADSNDPAVHEAAHEAHEAAQEATQAETVAEAREAVEDAEQAAEEATGYQREDATDHVRHGADIDHEEGETAVIAGPAEPAPTIDTEQPRGTGQPIGGGTGSDDPLPDTPVNTLGSAPDPEPDISPTPIHPWWNTRLSMPKFG